MAKNSITDYSKTASLNTDIQSVDIDEGCLPSGINNAIRELMADLAAVNDGTVALTSPAFTSVDINSGTIDGVTIGGASAAAGTFTTFTSTGIDDNASSTAVTINSSNNVGIGTAGRSASGYTILGVDNATNGGVIEVLQNGTIKGQLFYDGTQTRLRSNLSTDLVLDTNDTERLRIDSSGRVGIGTSSPDKALTISASDSQVRLYDADGTNQFASFQSDNGTTKITSRNNTSHGTIAFQRYNGTTVAESMRIDSSGNVLVGKTSTSSATTTVGFHVQPSGVAVLTRDGGAPLRVSRKTSDGEIISFHKDGTTVGSIGVISSRPYISTDYGSDSGLRFDSAFIAPCTTTGSGRDNAIDLGDTGNRFKSLYLSSDLVLGAADGYVFGNTNGVNIRASSGKSTIFDTAGSERMRIDSSGNVGIGTSSPDARLSIVDGTSSDQLRMGSSTSYYKIGRNTSTGLLEFNGIQSGFNGYVFGGANGERMRIDSSGRVGIGTSSPSCELTVSSGASSAAVHSYTQLEIESSSHSALQFSGSTGAEQWIWFADDASSTPVGGITYYHGGPYMGFRVEGSERMRIDSGGRLLVNGTSNLYGQSVMQVTSGSNSWTTMRNIDQGSAQQYTMVFARSSSNVGAISTTNTSTIFTTTSDYRLKENVTGITDGIERVKQLNPSRFNFIADADSTVDGFLAHEAATVVPEAVTGEKDAMRDEEYEVTPAVLDDDGNVVTEAVMGTRSVPDYQGIDQSKLVPLLTAALQEAIAKIEDLEARVATLETN